MTASGKKSHRTLGSDLARVDAHVTSAREYDELPDLTDAALRRGVRKRGGRPLAEDPRRQVTIRLRESVLARWRGSGAGWQTRMAEVLEKRAP